MLILLILSFIIGAVVGGVSGIGILGWVAGIFFFVCGLPGALITSFVHDEVSYAQDRADYRQLKSDIAAQELAETHEYAEDERNDRLVETIKKNPKRIYNDNRKQSVHLHEKL